MTSSSSPHRHTDSPGTPASRTQPASTLPPQLWSDIGLLDLIHDAIFARDMDGRIVYWNRSAEEHYGWSETEAIGQIAQELLRKSFPIPFPQIQEQLLRTGHWEGRVSHIDRSGSLLLLESRFVLMRNEQQEPAFIVEINHDITKHVLAEEELGHFFNLSSDLFAIAGLDGYFKRLNPAWEKTLGYSLNELQAKPYYDFVHPDDVTATENEAEKLQKGHETYSFENRYRCKDGSYKWLLWKSVQISEHKVIYATARDITERKQSELEMAEHVADLVDANRELQEFSYIASHDLQEPLRKIQAFGDRLQTKYADQLGEEGKDYLDRMQSATQRMRQLIEDLLIYSRTATRPQEIQKVDLSQVLEDVLFDLNDRIAEAGGEVIAGELPTIQGDYGQISQLFLNLLSNAVKFHKPDEPPQIKVAYIADADRHSVDRKFARIVIADNGIGFDEKYGDKIFQPFQRLHDRQTYQGTGIGLSICRKVVERHGGTIKAKSTPGTGTEFSLELPLWHEGASHE